MDDERLQDAPVFMPGIDLTLWLAIIFWIVVGGAIVTASLILIIG
jgi:membrane protein required for beta-lactamase induction